MNRADSKFPFKVLLFVIVLFLLLTSNPNSQTRLVDKPSGARNVVPSPADFLQLHAIAEGKPAAPDTNTLRKGKSTLKAMLLSAAIPGAGQIYTESYWKLPIIWGLGGYYVYEWIRNNDHYRDYRDQYLKSITPTNPQGNLQAKALRDAYRNHRDSFAWYLGILYLANIADAYVSASLYEFDVSDDLSLQIARPGQLLTIRWKW